MFGLTMSVGQVRKMRDDWMVLKTSFQNYPQSVITELVLKAGTGKAPGWKS